MTVLALDVGDRRIGVAVSDPTDLVVRPLAVIVRRSNSADADTIGRLVQETEPDTVVVGLPLHADATASAQSVKVRSFVRFISRRLTVPVVTWNEHGTTVAAQEEMINMGVPRAKRKALIDAAAAAVLLDDWLTSNRPRSHRSYEESPAND